MSQASILYVLPCIVVLSTSGLKLHHQKSLTRILKEECYQGGSILIASIQYVDDLSKYVVYPFAKSKTPIHLDDCAGSSYMQAASSSQLRKVIKGCAAITLSRYGTGRASKKTFPSHRPCGTNTSRKAGRRR